MSSVAKLAIDNQNPWPGLSAFDEAAERFFNGRTRETAELRRLVLNSSLTVLFGASGLGKTSLIQAGLFPSSRKEHFLPVYVRLDLVRRSDEGDGEPLIQQVKSAFERQIQLGVVEAPPFRQGESLWEYLHRAELEFWSPRNQLLTPLFVFDQFEEVFTLGAENAAAVRQFRSDLADLIENRIPATLAEVIAADETAVHGLTLDRQRYRIILSFREDYLPALEGWKRELPSLLRNRLRLLPMSQEQAFQAVHQTAPHLVDEPLAQEIVDFVASAREKGTAKTDKTGSDGAELTVEPALLSLVCHGLNDKRKAQGKAAFDEELLADSTQSIVADFYQNATGDLPRRVRDFIGNELITGRGFRKPCDVGDAKEKYGVTDEQLRLLVNRRLVRIEPQRGTERVELTHDLLTGVVREQRDRTYALRRRWRMSAYVFVPLMFAGLVLAYSVQKRRATAQQKFRDVQFRAETAERLLSALQKANEATITAKTMEELAAAAKKDKENAEKALEDANKARGEATVKFLALEAAGLGAEEQSLPLGMLLATESMRQQPTIETQAFLSNGLSLLPKLLGVLPKSSIQLATFTADGSLVTSEPGFVRVWDPMAQKELRQFHIDGRAGAIAASSDGQLVGVSYDKEKQGVIEVYNLHTGELNGQRLTAPKAVSHLFVGSNGTLTAFNGRLYHWNDWSDEQAGLLTDAKTVLDNGGAVATSSDQSLLALFDRNQSTISVVNLSNKRNNSWPVGQVPVADIVFDPSDQNHLASFDTNTGTIRLWDTRSQQAYLSFQGGSAIGVEFSADGRFFATHGWDGAIKVWDTRDGKAVASLFAKAAEARVALDGKNRIVAVTQDGSTQLWQIAEIPLPNRVLAAQISADGGLAALRTTHRTAQNEVEDILYYWNLASGRAERPINLFPIKGILGVMPGLRLAVGTCDPALLCIVQFGNDGTTKLIRKSKQTIPYPSTLIFSGNGRFVAGSSTHTSGGGRGGVSKVETSLIVWDIENQETEPEISDVPRSTTVLAVSPEGRCILRTFPTKDGPSELKLWDLNKKTFSDAPKPFHGHPLSISFNADGHWIATSQLVSSGTSAGTKEQKYTVSIWRWPDGGEPVTSFDIDTRVNKMSFSSNRRFLITAGAEAFIRVWDITGKTGQESGRVSLNRPGVPLAMAFTDADRRIVAFDQHSVKDSPWHPADLEKEACERIGRSLSTDEWDKYLPMEKGKYFPTCNAYLSSH